MIKRFAFVRRRPGVEVAAFHRVWRDDYAPALAGARALRKPLLRAELLHRLPGDYERERHAAEVVGPQWDGVEVQWFDSEADVRAVRAHPELREISAHTIGPLRTPETAQVLTHLPATITERPGGRERAGLRLVCILRRHPAFDPDRFHAHWLEHHGGLFRDVAELREPLLAYDQNHGIGEPGAEYDGVTEQWFESLKTWMRSLDVPAQCARVEPDVARMLDPASIQFILAGPPTEVLGSR
jgi:hypothetical protein